jgi:hypothetical protein
MALSYAACKVFTGIPSTTKTLLFYHPLKNETLALACFYKHKCSITPADISVSNLQIRELLKATTLQPAPMPYQNCPHASVDKTLQALCQALR